ncbi:Flp pilus assembly protein CpaB [Desulfitobacterium sp.]|uniref:Flp pilus assembly protein CpaB n=1 Tax=Desulfitobacterium sp. TaxID=49981 RepID=UPI002B9B205E|nr:Flp pilus assembly protein CpaB [Desulfitobacterium sp.]HVJ48567.1 Flp pilus assembly protein CpaB [Desulfitobacterium sp.]
MQRKGFLILALICGLIAAGSTYIFLSGTQRSPQISLKPLVIAKGNIPARSVIKAEQLTTKDIPNEAYPVGGASSIQSVVGSVALVNLTSGDSIVNSVIEHPTSNDNNSAASSALTVPDGKRAVAIPIGLVSGVGFMVKPGDHVDILVTMEVKDSSGNSQTVTTLAAQDALVLSNGESSVSDKTKVEAKSYTLALTVPQAMVITLGSEKGSLRLLLRNPANTDQQVDAPFTASQFLDPNYFNRYK